MTSEKYINYNDEYVGEKKNMRKTKEKNNSNALSNKSLIEKLFSKKEIVVSAIGILAAVYPILNYVFNIKYQSECEKFYGLPGKYFHSSIDSRCLYLICIILLVLACFIPLILVMSKHSNNKRIERIFVYGMTIVGSILVGLINAYHFVLILYNECRKYKLMNKIISLIGEHFTIVMVVIVIFAVISISGLILIETVRKNMSEKIRKIFDIIYLVSFVVTVGLIICGIFAKFSISIDDKRQYEFVTIEEERYIILSEHDDKILIVKFEIDEGGNYIFDTSKYSLQDKYDGIREYVDLIKSPIISKNGKELKK